MPPTGHVLVHGPRERRGILTRLPQSRPKVVVFELPLDLLEEPLAEGEEIGMLCVKGREMRESIIRYVNRGMREKGREGKGREGREGKGREGKGREGKGRDGMGREGKGREGRKGKGRDGKGREGAGREGMGWEGKRKGRERVRER